MFFGVKKSTNNGYNEISPLIDQNGCEYPGFKTIVATNDGGRNYFRKSEIVSTADIRSLGSQISGETQKLPKQGAG
jgi:hypothetical protein